ncbi:16S rRNA (cytosine(1402)-N(4))-methyltransferase [Filobacillus milosensis]|uniref:16S rRNA (Cytosine(1402)-N(4))-methyltransferase n=1 Tax=Filobacillus milosensis TaxID=94137 RepID=A0A4Y8IFF1_9BACI|nr:class I SAM-dependent methyltransferase [Filobacillus milosensis]TFB13804.1 16S rRNA (cytosine(1402)-N(4))-methyltransferase [Filobacillus milosensis]
MKQIIPFAHDILKESISEGDTVVDATLGNGHDSLFLSQLVGERGRVFSFDIQQEALDQSALLFQEHNVNNVDMVLKGHEFASDVLREKDISSIEGVIFNLGYLPGSDKQIATSSSTTIKAINQLFPLLEPQRYIVIVVYPGHSEGQAEKEELMQFLSGIPAKEADIVKYQMVNRSSGAPFAVALYKK